jgi:anti-sigma B factor antagonist
MIAQSGILRLMQCAMTAAYYEGEDTMSSTNQFSSHFELDTEKRICIVSLLGNLDPVAVEELHPQVQDLVGAGFNRFVFDLSRVDHIGSMGLRFFLGLANQLKPTGVVALCSAAGGVRTLFEMTRVDQLLPMYSSRTDALNAVQPDSRHQ